MLVAYASVAKLKKKEPVYGRFLVMFLWKRLTQEMRCADKTVTYYRDLHDCFLL